MWRKPNAGLENVPRGKCNNVKHEKKKTITSTLHIEFRIINPFEHGLCVPKPRCIACNSMCSFWCVHAINLNKYRYPSLVRSSIVFEGSDYFLFLSLLLLLLSITFECVYTTWTFHWHNSFSFALSLVYYYRFFLFTDTIRFSVSSTGCSHLCIEIWFEHIVVCRVRWSWRFWDCIVLFTKIAGIFKESRCI